MMSEDIINKLRGEKARLIADRLLKGESPRDIANALNVNLFYVYKVKQKIDRLSSGKDIDALHTETDEDEFVNESVQEGILEPEGVSEPESTSEQTTQPKVIKELDTEEEIEEVEEPEREEETIVFVETPIKKVNVRLVLSPDILYRYKIWTTYVNTYGKNKWDGSIEDFIDIATETLLKVCKIEIYAVAEIDGNKIVFR